MVDAKENCGKIVDMNKLRSIVSICVLLALLLTLQCCAQRQPDEPEAATTTAKASEPPQNTQPPARTEPTPPQKTTILYFSDMQADPDTGDYSGLGNLVSQALMGRERPDFAIIGGDSVNDGGDEVEWRLFHDVTNSLFDGLTTASVAGNHDNYALLSKQFDFPKEAPAKQGQGFFYTLDAGSVFFIMLDSNIMGAANDVDIRWLQEILQSDAARQADWLVAVSHHPMWPVSINPKDAERAGIMRESFLPILEEFGVSLVLCGHQHVYSRTLPMREDSAADDGSGIVQVMAASGDKPTYAMGDWDYVAATAPAPNFALLSADSESLRLTAFDAENSVIDEITIVK